MADIKFKNRIKDLRNFRGLTQTELANMCGCSQNTISAIENGISCPSAYLSGLIVENLRVSWEDCFYFIYE